MTLCQQKAAEGKGDVKLDFHLRIEKLLNANINATANLLNKMEILKNVIKSSLSTCDWKLARQEQFISNWIDVTREAEKWKKGNIAGNSHQTSSSFSYDGQQELNNLKRNSIQLYTDSGSGSDYGISSDNSEGSRIQPYRTKSRGLQTYF